MNIYVGNLGKDINEDDLKEAFEAFGKSSSVSVVKDKFSGEPRGFGFVEMPSKDEAQAAIDGLNGKELQGQTITVNEARDRTERRGNLGFGGGGGRGGGGGGGRGSGGNRGSGGGRRF
ncbi:MAG: RNA-binding protein [Calditrichaeota bacterium]|nr:MAG: RNA-binding protein [Calditrichota bacterium]